LAQTGWPPVPPPDRRVRAGRSRHDRQL